MSRRTAHSTAVVLFAALAVLSPLHAFGQEADSAPDDADDERVPVADNFSTTELVVTGSAAAVAVVIGYWGEHIVGFPDVSFGRPEPDSLDWRVSTRLNPDPDLQDPFLADVPDLLGNPLLVAGSGAYYGFGALGNWLWEDEDWIWDTRHEFLALAGAIASTELLIQSSKFAFGRERPRVVRRCDPPDDPCGEYGIPPERNIEPNRYDVLSFPGGHAGATAAVMSFLYLDLSNYLTHDLLEDSSDAVRFWIGRVLPVLPTYGLMGLIFYDRIYSQDHWLSDQVFGATVGLAAGNAFYFGHFDSQGEPRRRFADDNDDDGVGRLEPVVLPEGGVGVGWGFSWW